MKMNRKPQKPATPPTEITTPLLQLQQRRENVQADYYLLNGLVNYPALNDDQMHEEWQVVLDGLDRRLSDTEDYVVDVVLPAHQDILRRFKRPGKAGKYRGYPTVEEYYASFGRKYNTVRSRIYRLKLKVGLFVTTKPKRLAETTSASHDEPNHEPSREPSSKPESSMMVVVDKVDLRRELAALQGCIATDSTNPILSNCKLETTLDGEHGTLHLTAADSDMTIRTSCAAHVTRVGAVAVPGQKFHDYVRLLRDGPIAIEQLEDGDISVRLGRSSAESAGSDVDDFPALSPMPSDTIELSGVALRALIARTYFAIGKEESRYAVDGAQLIIKPDSITMVATDGHQLAEVVAHAPITMIGQVTALIPKNAMVQIKTLLDTVDTGVVGFAQDANTLFFQIGPRLLTAKKVAGAFPDYEKVLPKYDGNTIVVENSADFTLAVQRVAEYADSSSHAISLNLEGNELSLSAHSRSGESLDSMAVEYSGEPITVRFNALAILNFVKAAGTKEIRIDLREGRPGQFRPSEHDDYTFRFFLMPMRSEYQEADVEKAA
jgi:DNA polymerase-3 subunit beta